MSTNAKSGGGGGFVARCKPTRLLRGVTKMVLIVATRRRESASPGSRRGEEANEGEIDTALESQKDTLGPRRERGAGRKGAGDQWLLIQALDLGRGQHTTEGAGSARSARNGGLRKRLARHARAILEADGVAVLLTNEAKLLETHGRDAVKGIARVREDADGLGTGDAEGGAEGDTLNQVIPPQEDAGRRGTAGDRHLNADVVEGHLEELSDTLKVAVLAALAHEPAHDLLASIVVAELELWDRDALAGDEHPDGLVDGFDAPLGGEGALVGLREEEVAGAALGLVAEGALKAALQAGLAGLETPLQAALLVLLAQERFLLGSHEGADLSVGESFGAGSDASENRV
eukprot:CAMPEP_0202077094 /NCGR_PEP_ID=MMETSP0964-20121228/5188_1 /ASSEMBLY_ACC=CAM_ASM_000500 /TAXON_ID=4773 /ORGANISM="Schizochytrium aggregatum, Strain ATCC28209" /LENGTH=345 /DNA_ID=CAMNT_0048644355 /DNA_START=84 /DNA_END=1119 /DNA_ORIENTATION=-